MPNFYRYLYKVYFNETLFIIYCKWVTFFKLSALNFINFLNFDYIDFMYTKHINY